MSGTSPDSVSYPIVGYGVAVSLDDGNGTYNWATLTESGTGQPARVLANGYDSNVSLSLVPKGTGGVTFGANYADYMTITGAANTGVVDTASPVIQAEGAATTLDVKVLGKGTGGRLNSTRLYIGHSSARASVDDRQISDFRANMIYATTPAAAYRWGGNIAGTITSGTADFGLFAIDTDTADPTTGSGPGGISGFRVGHNLTGGKGGRTAFSAGLNITGAFTASATGAGSFQTAGGFRAQASASAGGSAGLGNQRGNLFGINPIAEIKTGAGLYWQQIVGGEITLAVETGTGVNYKTGFQVVQSTNDQVSGSSGEDMGYLLGNGVTGSVSVGWDIGYCFGSKWTWWPMKSTGTMIGTGTSFAGGPSYAAAWGIDFSAVTFSAGFLKSTGFEVNGSGRMKVTAWGNYANDAAAAAGGVPVTGVYRNGSVLMVRVV